MAYLQRYLPEHAGDLIGIASRWQEFQRIARTMLIAAGLAAGEPAGARPRPDPAGSAAWRRPSAWCATRVTALELPPGVFPMRFTLLDAASLAPLRAMEATIAGEGDETSA